MAAPLPPPPPRLVQATPHPDWARKNTISPDRLAWAKRHNISVIAMAELIQMEGTYPVASEATGKAETENELQALIVLESPKQGCWVSRNNVGAYQDDHGNFIRYGLCNRTKDENKRVKSSDLIGFRKLLITPEMVGSQVAQFLAREVKEPGWSYRGSAREVAQLAFINFVNANGGDAAFASGIDTFTKVQK